ncbi:MAG: inositol monophosphatase family protein, partial [Planctomycetota bacterium]
MLLDTSQLVTVTREAGALALDRFGSATLEARRKADGSWVTEADTAVEELLIRRLTALEPDLGILAEERASRGITSRERDRVCAIDPIDGTASYVAGVPFWCVSVGLMVGGRPDSGAVFLPPLSKMFATDGRALGL